MNVVMSRKYSNYLFPSSPLCARKSADTSTLTQNIMPVQNERVSQVHMTSWNLKRAFQHLTSPASSVGDLELACNINVAPNANFVINTGKPMQHQAFYEEYSAFEELIRDLPNYKRSLFCIVTQNFVLRLLLHFTLDDLRIHFHGLF